MTDELAETDERLLPLAEAIVYARELFEAAPWLTENRNYVPGCGPLTWRHLHELQKYAESKFESEALYIQKGPTT